MAWKKGEPVEGILAPRLNDVIRDNNDALELYLNREHIFSTGGEVEDQLMHSQGSARAFFQDSAPATRVDGSAFASTDLGLFWIDTNSSPVNQLNILTATTPTWTPVSTEIIALLVSQINTWALAQTLSVSPVFTKGIVANNAYLQGRNAANDGNVDLIKVGTNNLPTLPDSAEMASSAAPVEDEAIVNKKYVDDRGFINRGDPAGNDFVVGSLTTDATWRDLDLSGVVPAGAKAVLLRVEITDNLEGSSIQFRKNGNSNTANRAVIRTQVSGLSNDGDLIVACDSSRVVEYNASNTTFTKIDIAIKGWFF